MIYVIDYAEFATWCWENGHWDDLQESEKPMSYLLVNTDTGQFDGVYTLKEAAYGELGHHRKTDSNWILVKILDVGKATINWDRLKLVEQESEKP